MKKDRNSFFSQYGMSAYNANQPFMYPPANANMSAGMSSSMNVGVPPTLANINMNNGYDASDLDARLSKIERELQRIDSRLNKLESTIPNTSISNNDYNFANSMYMV